MSVAMYTISVVAEDVGGYNNATAGAENVFRALAHACTSITSASTTAGTADGSTAAAGTGGDGTSGGVTSVRAQSNLPVKLTAAASVPFIVNLKRAASSVHLYGLSAVTGTSVRCMT